MYEIYRTNAENARLFVAQFNFVVRLKQDTKTILVGTDSLFDAEHIKLTLTNYYQTPASLYVDKNPRIFDHETYHLIDHDHMRNTESPANFRVNAYRYLRGVLPRGTMVYTIRAGTIRRKNSNADDSLWRAFYIEDNELIEITIAVGCVRYEGLKHMTDGMRGIKCNGWQYAGDTMIRNLAQILHDDSFAFVVREL
jgi:hypothetical protein